jgi:hypothetical protein
VGVVAKLLLLPAEDMSVTSPLPLNTQPVAGTITMGLDCGFAEGFFELCCCDVVAGNRVSVQTTSLVRGSSGLGGKPPRPVIVKPLPPESKALQLVFISSGALANRATTDLPTVTSKRGIIFVMSN